MKRTCDDCPAKNAIKVPGFGSSEPGILFVGESPGAFEIKDMRAFSPRGASGDFLQKVLVDLGEDPNDHYYDNVVMCPCTGKPPAAKINVCIDGLYDRIEELQPRLIVPMGNTAAKAVGMYSRGISFVRSQYREIELDNGRYGILPTYHPAAILRSPDLFRDFAKDVEKAVRIANGTPPVIPPPYDDYDIVLTYEHLADVWPQLENAKAISVDLEYRNSFNVPGCILEIGIGYGRGLAVSIDWKLFEESQEWLDALADLLESKPNIYQHAMADITYLWEYGIYPKVSFDTEVAHWLLDERASGHGLEAMAIEYYNAPPYKSQFRARHGIGRFVKDDEEFGKSWAKIPQVDRMLYNAADADYTWRLGVDMKKQLREQDMMPLMKLILQFTELYSDLFVQGIWIDQDNLRALEEKLIAERDEAEAILRKYAPDVNPRSTKQLAEYFYDELGLEPIGGVPADGREISMDILSAAIMDVDDEEAQLFWKTSRPALFGGTGKIEKQEGLSSRSTSMFMLYWLAQQHEYPRALIQYKKATKRLATYVGQVKNNLWPDGRIRPEYRVVGHLHGRFGSSKPVIHNLPNEQDIYNLYMAPPGYVILTADYKQADLRLMAHFADDDNLREWLKGDPHSEVVKVIRRLSDAQIERIKEERPDEYKRSRLAAKAVNFGMMYGRGADSLAPQLGISIQEARTWMKRYWERLHKTKAWMDARGDELMRNGQEYIGPFGNRRRFPLLISRAHVSKAAKLGVNFPIMSSVNYLTAIAHVRVVNSLRERGIDAKVYPHIHDAISVAVPEEHAQESAELMKHLMAEIPHEYGFDSIEWPVDVEIGTHWGTRDVVEIEME